MGLIEPMAIVSAMPQNILSVGDWATLATLMISLLAGATVGIVLAAQRVGWSRRPVSLTPAAELS